MENSKIDKILLLEIFSRINELVKGTNITLYALGGTALTLLDMKPASADIDLIINKDDWDLMRAVLNEVGEEYSVRIDKFYNDWMGTYWLPDDFRGKSIGLTYTDQLEVKSLSLVDILLTKLIAHRPKDLFDVSPLVRLHPESLEFALKRYEQDYVFNVSKDKKENKEIIERLILGYLKYKQN